MRGSQDRLKGACFESQIPPHKCGVLTLLQECPSFVQEGIFLLQTWHLLTPYHLALSLWKPCGNFQESVGVVLANNTVLGCTWPFVLICFYDYLFEKPTMKKKCWEHLRTLFIAEKEVICTWLHCSRYLDRELRLFLWRCPFWRPLIRPSGSVERKRLVARSHLPLLPWLMLCD